MKITLEDKVVFFLICLWNFKLIWSSDGFGVEMDIDSREFEQLSNSLSHFSFNLYQAAVPKSSQGNIIVAPLSTHILLCLLLSGSNGVTKQELKSALYVSNLDESCEQYKQLQLLKNNQKADVKIASAMFVNLDFILKEDFLLKSKSIFNVNIENIEPSNSVDCVKKINNWVGKVTKGKISNIVTNEDFNEYTKIILANILHFKSNWLKPFDIELNERKKFYNVNHMETNVIFMFQTVHVPHGYIKKLDAHFIKIQYLDEQLEMIIVLPKKKHGLHELEKNFKWNNILKASCTTKEVHVSLPKFSIESTVDLKTIVQEMSIHSVFDKTANFSLVSEKPLFVDKMVQKLYIDVDEKGSEAAVATVAHIRSRRMVVETVSFMADHPFMFAINYKPSGIPLFIGAITKLEEILKRDEL